MNQTDGRPTIGHHPRTLGERIARSTVGDVLEHKEARASRLECTSDDPSNHQGDTCPIHEAPESNFPALETKANDGIVSAEELETAMRDAQDLMEKANRMLGWSHLLPEQAIEGLRVGRDMADAVYVGLRNAYLAAATPRDTGEVSPSWEERRQIH